MSEQATLVKVADLFLVKQGDDYVGMELGFNENVLNRQGGAMVLDTLRGAMNSSTWVASTLLRAPVEGQANAQADQGANQSSDTDDEGTGKARRKVKTDVD